LGGRKGGAASWSKVGTNTIGRCRGEIFFLRPLHLYSYCTCTVLLPQSRNHVQPRTPLFYPTGGMLQPEHRISLNPPAAPAFNPRRHLLKNYNDRTNQLSSFRSSTGRGEGPPFLFLGALQPTSHSIGSAATVYPSLQPPSNIGTAVQEGKEGLKHPSRCDLLGVLSAAKVRAFSPI